MHNPLEHAQELMLWGNYSEARQIIVDLLEANPNSDILVYYLGLCELTFNNIDAAISYFKECLEINPLNIDAMVDLAEALQEQEKSETAGLWLRRAMQLAPDNPRSVVSMARYYDANEDYASAIPLYEKAMLIGDPFEAPRYELAIAYGKTKRYLEADLILEGMITESLRKGTRLFIGEEDASHRMDLAENIRIMREDRDEIACDYQEQKGYDLNLSRIMYYAIRQIVDMGPQSRLGIYREIRILEMLGYDHDETNNRYRLQAIPGFFSGVYLACLYYALAKEMTLDIPGSPAIVNAWEEARRLFPA